MFNSYKFKITLQKKKNNRINIYFKNSSKWRRLKYACNMEYYITKFKQDERFELILIVFKTQSI